MKQFDNVRAHKPENIENRNGYIVGGGIAGLVSAVFLTDDGYMPGKNITIFEKLSDVGGSMDATKNNQGYVCRGERELEPYMVMYPGYDKSVATKKQVLNPEYPKQIKSNQKMIKEIDML